MSLILKQLRYFVMESHIRWLLYILVVEYMVAISLPPTILTDYTIAYDFVEVMSFFDAVHAFNEIALYPESVSFFIALSFVLLIPKAISIYFFLQNNPYSQLSQFVITPYTQYKPHRSLNWGEVPDESQAEQLLTEERSLVSRLVWSILSLGLAVGFFWMFLSIGISHDRELIITQSINQGIANGSTDMWWSISVWRAGFAALMLAVSFFIIKDYYRFSKELTNKVLAYFK